MREGKYKGDILTKEEKDILHRAEKIIRESKWAELFWEKGYTTFNFKPEWNVKIDYPYFLKYIRFVIEYKDKFVSVYLDTATRYSAHYEAVTDTELKQGRWYLEEKDEMMKWIEEYLNNKESK